MLIRRRGYHRWEGRLGSCRWAWLAVLGNGLRLGMKQKHAALLLWSALPLAALAAALFYIVALVQREAEAGVHQPGMLELVFWFVGAGELPTRNIGEMLAKLTVPIWTLVFARLCQIELFLVLLVHAKFGSDLIAGDIRTNALPIYFSKPITAPTYWLGKWLVAVVFACVVTLVPNVVACVAGMVLSGSAAQFAGTTELLGRLVLYSLLVAGTTGLFVLALSALTRDRRFAAVAWFVLALLPIIVQQVLDNAVPGHRASGLLGSVSLVRNFGRVGYWILGVEDAVAACPYPQVFGKAAGSEVLGADLGYSLAVLAAIAFVCLVVSVGRIRRFQVAVASA